MAQNSYDAIIVGSGAGGGMATNQLANAGLKVALVEAGDFYDPADEKQRTQLRFPWESPRRGASTQRRPFGDFNACIGGWELDDEPLQQPRVQSLCGGEPGCSEAEQTIGGEYPSDSVPLTSSERTQTV